MAEIALTRGRVALVDEEDVAMLSKYRWVAGTRYAVTYLPGPKRRPKFMHRLLLSPPEGMEVDHVNGNALDNRRANLRLATRAQNCANRRSGAVAKSGYRGVQPLDHGYEAKIKRGGKSTYLGTFGSAREAAQAYDNAAEAAFGEFAVLNLPQDRGAPVPRGELKLAHVESRNAQILALHGAGRRPFEIVRELGVTKGAVAFVLRRARK